MIGVIIICIIIVMEGGCEKKGDSELRDPSRRNHFKNCMKDIVTVITGTFRHMQGFISTRDTCPLEGDGLLPTVNIPLIFLMIRP